MRPDIGAPGGSRHIRELIEAGALRTVVDRVFPLDHAAEAHRYAESGAKTGAVVITVAPPAAA